MVLAHWLVEPEYLAYYRRKALDDFLILDNGCCELGKSVPIDQLLDAYDSLDGLADVVVVPDIKEGDNQSLFMESVNVVRRHTSKHTALMAVPQSEPDLVTFIAHPDISYLGLSRDWELIAGRAETVSHFSSLAGKNGKKFHMLGMYRDPVAEVRKASRLPCVSGIDSSLPFRLVNRASRISECRPFPDLIDMYAKRKSEPEVQFMVEEFRRFIQWVERL